MLYVVASPIGNLEDMTFRSIRILNEVDTIFCEDTRVTKKLLSHYNISKPTIRYIDDSRQNFYLEILSSGDVALISDAGTPLLSDPGYKLINLARQNDISVISIPGASALMASISISGKPLNEFVFDGFFPRSNKDQLILLSKLNLRTEDTFVFESPKRISKTINLLKEKLKDRNIILFHELTKLHEKVISFNLSEIDTTTIPNIGEFVILISGESSKNELFDEDFDKYVKVELEYMIQNGLSLKNATKIISEIFDLPRKNIYNIWIEK
tara:strand:+ start:1190 stop:1996 length:807 start_codon:yes stop_codon:yes gene_type:complete